MQHQTTTPRRPTARLARAAQILAIFIALLAAAAILHPPRYADGSQQSQDATLAECLRYLRTQIYIYSLDHNGIPPGFPGNDVTLPPDADTFVAQMTQYTDQVGRYSTQMTPRHKFGPYLMAVPANPANLHSGVIIVSTDGMPRADDAKPYGWIYNPATRQIIPNLVGADSQGVSYASY
jgi:hypothetical protein